MASQPIIATPVPPDAPAWVATARNPYLEGLYAPTTRETDGHLCTIEGDLPTDFDGIYLRNGPNNQFPPKHRHHWFDGDAMMHGLTIRNGTARYANKWIKTSGFEAERKAGHAIWPGVMGPFDFSLPGSPIKDTANTDVIGFNGRALALWYYTGQPYAFDPVTLETTGRETFDGTLPFPISAHAHVDEHSGDMLVFSFNDTDAVMRYGVISPHGKLVHSVDVPLPGPRAPHDIGFTQNYTILHDLPFFHDAEVLQRFGRRVVSFHRDMPARFGIIPRFGAASDTRWFEAKPCYILHVVNCWEDGDWITMDGYRTADPSIVPDKADGDLSSMLAYLRLTASYYRWRFNLVTGETREAPMDDFNTEFCRINTAVGGRKSRYHYVQHIPFDKTLSFKALVKYDGDTGTRQTHDYGDGVYGSESPFAPKHNAQAEDDGYVLTFTTSLHDWSSQCLVFDAKDISHGPVCKINLPQRLPMGFHATWIPGAQVWG